LFLHLWVNNDQALAIRAHFLSYLTKEFGRRQPPLMNEWADVVDEAIYHTR
jgi:hypothetical protein